MEVLFRQILVGQDGQQDYRDSELSVDSLRIGAGIDCEIQWLGTSVGSLHATLTAHGDELQLKCASGSTVLINGESVKSGHLAAGDDLSVDSNHLRLIAAPSGFDYAIELETDGDVQVSLFEKAYRTDLSQTWLSRRLTAWSLAALVVLGFLILPMVNSSSKEESMVSRWVPSERMFSSGPLHEAHQLMIGDDCKACHRQAFERVPDEQCLTCHAVADHLPDSDGLPRLVNAEFGTLYHEDTGGARCATCHQEHNEPSHLVLDHNSLCTDCHTAELSGLASVDSFSAGEHPAFSVEMPQPIIAETAGGKTFTWQMQRTAVASAVDKSQLKFPHDLHLDPNKVQRLDDSQGLACGNCHERSADPEHFQPVVMEKHCKACHGLRFDAADPEAELPHGNPIAVIMTLEGHYLRKLVTDDVDPKARIQRKIPDRPPQEAPCTDTAFNCAQFFASRDAQTQFESSGCNNCHEIFDNGGADLHSRFQVLPVKLAGDFLTRSRFNHDAHMTLVGEDGDSSCGICHQASASSASTDVLIPDVQVCQSCHDNPGSLGKVGMNCVSCHEFHRPPAAVLDFDVAANEGQ